MRKRRRESSDEDEVLRILGQAVMNGAIIENRAQHAASIMNMLGKHRILD